MAQARSRSASQATHTEGEEASHSGRLLLRMPPELHAELARSAARAGTSLNAYINGILSAATEAPAPPPRRDRLLRAALVADVVLVAVAAVLAIVLLIVAWP